MAILISAEPAGLKFARYIAGLQILEALASLTPIGVVAGLVIAAIAHLLFLAYLLVLRATRQRKVGSVPLWSRTNRFGVSTFLAAAFVVWSGISLFWTPSKSSAAPFFADYLAQVLIVYFLCTLYPLGDVAYSLCKGTAYASAAMVPLSIVLGGYSGGRLGDVSTQSFLVALIAFGACLGVFGVVYLVLSGDISKKLGSALLAFLLLGLYLTFSKTEIIALAIAGTTYVILSPGSRKQRLARVGKMVLAMTVGLVLSFSKIAEYQDTGTADTLSGRTILWTQSFAQISSGPFIRGFGFSAFREIGPVPWHDLESIVNAHNEFLTVWFNFGLVGVILVFAAYFTLAYKAFKSIRHKRNSLSLLVLSAVVFTLVRGVTEANSVMCDLPIWWLILFDCLVSSPDLDPNATAAQGQFRMAVQ